MFTEDGTLTVRGFRIVTNVMNQVQTALERLKASDLRTVLGQREDLESQMLQHREGFQSCRASEVRVRRWHGVPDEDVSLARVRCLREVDELDFHDSWVHEVLDVGRARGL